MSDASKDLQQETPKQKQPEDKEQPELSEEALEEVSGGHPARPMNK